MQRMAQRPRDRSHHHAKVRVAGSNPDFRSRVRDLSSLSFARSAGCFVIAARFRGYCCAEYRPSGQREAAYEAARGAIRVDAQPVQPDDMSGNRDKKRKQRRRADQQRHATARRERQRRSEDVIRSLLRAIAELQSLAVDETKAPALFAQELAKAIAGDDIVAGLLADPEDGWRRAEEFASEVSPERSLALAAALCADGADTSATRWWACGFFCGADDERRAEAVATAALEALGPVGTTTGPMHLVAELRFRLERFADAMELACSLVEADPSDEEAQHLQALSLRAMANHDSDGRALQTKPCPCGAGAQPWADCCRPREQEAVARFTDRERLYALRFAVGAFIAQNAVLERHLEESRDAWADALGDPHALPDYLLGPTHLEEESAFRDREILALERAWMGTPGLDVDTPQGQAADRDDDDAGAILRLYAADVTTPPELALLARTWQEDGLCGLWQVADLEGGPNLWLMDIVTGETRWVSMAPEQLEGAGRWSVLAGWLVPDRGVWRSGGAFVHLSPDEGDIAAEIVRVMAEDVAETLLRERRGRKQRQRSWREPELNPPPPHGILSCWTDEPDPMAVHLHSTILGIALPDVIATATEGRRRQPVLHNTDGEQLEMLRARGHVEDPQALRIALQRRPDFDGPDAEGRLTWRGREMTALEAETSLAEVRALAAERGVPVPGEKDEGPHHWVRGLVEIDDHEVSIEVNSRTRLDGVAAILARLGVGPLVVDQRFDPSLDLPDASGWRPLGAVGSPEAETAWSRRWLDEALPALGDLTPRQAVTEPRAAVELERLLRRLEFDADLAAHRGQRALDVERIRRELGEHGRLFEL